MTVHRNELALDLERLGLKAIAGSVANHTVSVERVMRSVERTRDKRRERGDPKGAEACQAILNKYWGEASG